MRPRLQMHVLRSSRAAFPVMPEGRAAYDNTQKSWLGRSRRLRSVIPLSARLPPSPIIPPKWSWHLVCISWTPETDSWVTESGLCGRIMTAEAKSSGRRKYSSLRWTQNSRLGKSSARSKSSMRPQLRRKREEGIWPGQFLDCERSSIRLENVCKVALVCFLIHSFLSSWSDVIRP